MQNELGDLPEMRSAVLDDNGVAALFRDIRALTRVNEIIVKDRPGRVNDAHRISLEEAEQIVLAREVRGLQIRYYYDDADWWDTLMRTPEGVRLVRIRHDFDAT